MSMIAEMQRSVVRSPGCRGGSVPFLVPTGWLATRRRKALCLKGVALRRRCVARGTDQTGDLTEREAVPPAALGRWVANFATACGSLAKKIESDVKTVDSELVNGEIRAMAKRMRLAAVLVPFASASGVRGLILITKAISSFINVYLLLLFVRVLLTWFPTFRWDRNPWMILRQVTDPYLNLFRGLVPPLLGTIDFTPLLGFFILQWISGSLAIGDEEIYW